MPRERIQRPPAEIEEAIGRKSIQLRFAAASLQTHIENFQKYLGSLDGRVEAECFGVHPDAATLTAQDKKSFGLKFHRPEKEWIISWGRDAERESLIAALMPSSSPIRWTPLLEAPMKIKIAAIKMFPDLLAAVEDSQDRLVNELAGANKWMESFWNVVKQSSIKEGK